MQARHAAQHGVFCSSQRPCAAVGQGAVVLLMEAATQHRRLLCLRLPDAAYTGSGVKSGSIMRK